MSRAKKTKPAPELLKVYDTTRVPLGDLMADPGNPREIGEVDFEALVASVGEFGLVEPFVARLEDKRVVGGHQRSKAVAEWLRRAGVAEDAILLQQVTVVFVPGLSESRCRALNLALNRISGGFNYDLMAGYVGGVDAADLHLTGFIPDELNDILHLAGMPEPPPGDPDEYLADMNLKFGFKVATADEATLVRDVLAQYGMTSPKDAGVAFVLAMRAAVKRTSKRPPSAAE